jgi:hypothetical protein
MDIPKIIVVENPLRTVKITANISRSTHRINFHLPQEYIDLSVGTWSVALDYIITKPKARKAQYDTLFELRSSLLMGIEFERHLERSSKSFVPYFSVLRHIHYKPRAQGGVVTFSYEKVNPIWFIIDSPKQSFDLFLEENNMIATPGSQPNEFYLELGLLFRRMQ